MFKKILSLLTYPWTRYQERKKLKKRLEELRKRDPFIYK
jgi:hypothetical protein